MMRQIGNTQSNIQDMNFTSFLSLNRLGEVEDVAHLIEFLLSHKSSFITGATINIDGGSKSRTLPMYHWAGKD
jgi:NAD(P)-dependent dehydrogenase (short-subunit alcohol dehydrogenase family)